MIDYKNYLSKEDLLKVISQEDIYRYYLGSLPINKSISSPYRKDLTPSFSLFYSNNGRLIFKDYAYNETGDCFTFVMKLFNISFKESLIKIQKDVIHKNISGITNTKVNLEYNKRLYPSYNKRQTEITIQQRDFQKQDLEYWIKYNINEDILQLLNIKVADKVYYNSKLWRVYSKYNPIYVYPANDNLLKLYFPLADKAKKWSGTVKSDYIYHLDLLPDNYNELIILTKAVKDVGTLYSLGYKGICFSSESVLLNQDLLDKIHLKSYKIFGLYDNDMTGLNQIANLKKFNIPGCTIEENINSKRLDVSDFFMNYGKERTEEKIKELLNKNKN